MLFGLPALQQLMTHKRDANEYSIKLRARGREHLAQDGTA